MYILDQVRALEKEMHKRIEQQGLDVVPQILVVTRLIPDAKGTSCNQRLEKINGCSNAQILRVPFKQKNGDVLQQWVSRYVSVNNLLQIGKLAKWHGAQFRLLIASLTQALASQYTILKETISVCLRN